MSDLSDKLSLERELPRHLRELGLLIGRPVDKGELLPLGETKRIRAQANDVSRHPRAHFELPFDAKQETRFVTFIQRLISANPSEVYLWTPTSNVCGVLRPLPLAMVRLGFPFDSNPEGILLIITSDLRDQLLFDYSIGNEGKQFLEVEVSGQHWGTIAY